MDYTAVGQTTHLAARMEQMATPGTILLGPATLQLRRGLRAGRGPGAGPRSRACRTPWRSTRHRRECLEDPAPRGRRAGLTRFVGRDAEIEQIRPGARPRARWPRPARRRSWGNPAWASPASSTSSLIPTAPRTGSSWKPAPCPTASQPATCPSSTSSRPTFKIHDRETHRENPRKGHRQAPHAGSHPRADPAALLALADVPSRTSLQALDPAQRRQRTLDAAKRLLLRRARGNRSSSSSRTCTGSMPRRRPCSTAWSRVCLRPGFSYSSTTGPSNQHGWVSKTYYSQLRLDALPPASAGKLLSALLGDDPALEPSSDCWSDAAIPSSSRRASGRWWRRVRSPGSAARIA